MAKVITTENPSRDVRRYLGHWSDKQFVTPRLKEQHPNLSSDRRRLKASQISVLVAQGLEFLASADSSSVLTRPLSLFYAAENLAKAACVKKVEVLGANDFHIHGLSGDRETKRYAIKNLSCKVQKPKKDVWSAVFQNLNLDRSRIELLQGGLSLIQDRVDSHAMKPLKPGATMQLGDLLRHLPELADDVVFAGWGHPHVVRAENLRLSSAEEESPDQSLSFRLRHGHHQPTKAMIQGRRSDLLKRFREVRDAHDVLDYEIGPVPGPVTIPITRLDVFGETFMDFARGTRVFGELVIYFAGLFILSDVARYQPQHWLRLLDDHPAEAVLVDRFLDIGLRKLPNLILNELQEEIFLFRMAR